MPHLLKITVDASDDGSGVAATEYRIDGGPWTEHTGPFEVSEDGEHVIDFRSTDEAGNVEEAKSLSFKIDATAPEVMCAATPGRLWPPNHRLAVVTVDVQVDDATSGPGGFTLDAVTSSEPDAGTSGEDVPGDIQGWDAGTADTTGRLRAECADGGPGRVYTIAYEARDQAGSTAGCHTEVTVPKRVRPRA